MLVVCERDVLDARPFVELEVLVDLALALALGRLVDRELDLALRRPPSPCSSAPSTRSGSGRRRSGRCSSSRRRARRTRPSRSSARARRCRRRGRSRSGRRRCRRAVRRERDVAGEVRARVVGAVDERVDVLAVGRDRRQLDAAVLVLDPARLGDAARAALDGLRGTRRATSGTCSATSFAAVAVPARRTGRSRCRSRSPLVSTSRISPCSSTYEARSRTPVSGPAYATRSKPSACSYQKAACLALPTQSSRWSHPSSGMKSCLPRAGSYSEAGAPAAASPSERGCRRRSGSPPTHLQRASSARRGARARRPRRRTAAGSRRASRARRRSCAIDAEPEHVRQHERPERREHEQHPHLPAERVVLIRRLRQRRRAAIRTQPSDSTTALIREAV